MKKFTTLVLLMALAMLLPAQADNYFTMGVNDTLRLHPSLLNGTTYIPASAHFEARLNHWYITVNYPSGLAPEGSYSEKGVSAGPDMTVSYKTYLNHDTIYEAHLTDEVDYTILSSYIPVIGYHDYDNDGIMEPYGPVKWEAGDYDNMFVFRFFISSSFRNGFVSFNGQLTSDYDARGGYLLGPCNFYRAIYVYVGLKRGDLTGDNYVNTSDVNLLINYMMDPDNVTLDEFQLAAADVSGDGQINITDVNMLINLIMNS